MTIHDALERFLAQLEADGRSSHTVRQYRRHGRLFAHWAAQDGHPSPQVEALDHLAIARFLTSPEARTRPDGRAKKASAVNALRSSLRVFTAYLHRAGYLLQDPGRLVRRALCAGGPPRALSSEDEARLLAALAGGDGADDQRDHALFHLMLRTGVRLSGAIGLDVEDLDLRAGELTIRSKDDRTERVFLGQAITDHLRRYAGDRTSGPLSRHGMASGSRRATFTGGSASDSGRRCTRVDQSWRYALRERDHPGVVRL